MTEAGMTEAGMTEAGAPSAAATDARVTTAPGRAARPDDLRLARLHLRMGELTLARAELEDLLRRDALGIDGFASLAEARWRTGDAPLAADAAFAHLEGGGNEDVALAIAAEAVAADGRPAEARQLMDRLRAADSAALDALFAGMPRRAFWPAGPVERSDAEELRRDTELRAAYGRLPERAGLDPRLIGGREVAGAALETAPEMRSVPGPREVLRDTAGAEWAGAREANDLDQTVVQALQPPAERPARPHRVKGQLDPAAELERARDELQTRPERALLRLSLVLRHDPTLAPTVLELLRLRRDAMAALVRGDAQRLLGRHLEAEAAFDAAAESLEAS
jgi:tetratricopeptide (TPR) repeat protein